MPLVQLVLVFIVAGVLLGLVNRYIPVAFEYFWLFSSHSMLHLEYTGAMESRWPSNPRGV